MPSPSSAKYQEKDKTEDEACIFRAMENPIGPFSFEKHSEVES